MSAPPRVEHPHSAARAARRRDLVEDARLIGRHDQRSGGGLRCRHHHQRALTATGQRDHADVVAPVCDDLFLAVPLVADEQTELVDVLDRLAQVRSQGAAAFERPLTGDSGAQVRADGASVGQTLPAGAARQPRLQPQQPVERDQRQHGEHPEDHERGRLEPLAVEQQPDAVRDLTTLDVSGHRGRSMPKAHQHHGDAGQLRDRALSVPEHRNVLIPTSACRRRHSPYP